MNFCLWVLALLPSVVASAQPPTHETVYLGPLIDVHSHVTRGRHGHGEFPFHLEATLDTSLVSRIFLMPTPNTGRNPDAPRLRGLMESLRTEFSERVSLICGGDVLSVAMATAKNTAPPINADLAALSARFKSGACVGLGEIGYLHFNKGAKQKLIHLPPSYSPLRRLAAFASKNHVPLDIHAEVTDPTHKNYEYDLLTSLTEMFRQSPDLKVICSHRCFLSAASARRFLNSFPGLSMSLRSIQDEDYVEAVLGPNGNLNPTWAELIEDMPDRFLVGLDYKFGRNDEEGYTLQAQTMRQILSALKPETARLVAFKNANRLFPIGDRGGIPLKLNPDTP